MDQHLYFGSTLPGEIGFKAIQKQGYFSVFGLPIWWLFKGEFATN